MRVEISAVDRYDLDVTAWKHPEGWIEIYIKSAVGIAVPIQLSRSETLILVVVPEKRGRILAETNRKMMSRYSE